MLLRNQVRRCNPIHCSIKSSAAERVLQENAGLSVHVFASICPFDLYVLLKRANRSNHVSNFRIFISIPRLYKYMIVN